MERLTKRLPSGTAVPSENWIPTTYEATCQELAQRLADYEDAEEQGRLIEFPVSIGQHLWAVDDYGCISELTVRELVQTLDDQQILADSLGIVTYYSLSRIGETIFPTREQAHAKLKELEKQDGKE